MTITFKDLIVWQKSVELAVYTYSLTSKFPDIEKFNLISQMNRSVVSISSNIAEGSQRSTVRDYINFLRIAKGSLAEFETQIIISQKLNLIEEKDYNNIVAQIDEIRKILNRIIFKLTPKTSHL